MKFRKLHIFKKFVLIIIISIIFIIGISILLLSPLSVYLISNYGGKYTGRHITVDWAYINPLHGTINISGLKIYEAESDSIFFSAKDVSANISMLKLLWGTYEIKNLMLNRPRGIIIQNGKSLNFNDLIDKFSPEGNADTTKKNVHFSILRVKIINGEFHYREQQIPINYFIKNVNIESSGKRWDADTINLQFSLMPGTGSGDMKGDLTVNVKTYDYRISVLAHKFDLGIIAQYLNELINYGSFTANIDASIRAEGNINDQENLAASGQIAINDFHFGKNPKEDLASFEKLGLSIVELNPKGLKYIFDSLTLIHPCFKYEIYDYLDNLQRIFGENGSNIETANANSGKFNLIISLARYVKVLATSFLKSNYKIARLRIDKGDIKFNDFSKSEKFSLELYPLTVIADSVDKDRSKVNMLLQSPVKPFGNVSVSVSLNPNDSSDFDMQYHFKKLAVSMFNPYIISVTSFPLDRGTLEFNGSWKVRSGKIQSTNHLIIIDPRTTKRIRNKDIKWIPVPLIMSFIRERGNVIDYEIPITGNLKDPKFHLHYVIFDLLKNIFVKPPSTSYRVAVKNVETEIEKSISLKWEKKQSNLSADQEKFIDKMGDFLAKSPNAEISVYPLQFAVKEKEYILFFEAKKKFFLETNNKNSGSFSSQDSEKVDKMSIKDPFFVKYLNKHITDSLNYTIQGKCAGIIDSAFINRKYDQLNKERQIAFMLSFKKRKVDDRVKILKGQNVIPYNGFSFYKVEYKGDFPESLIKAYNQLNELDNEAPRKKFREERKAIEKKTSGS
jgi:hypothetical protein